SLAMNGRARTRYAQTDCPSDRSLLLRSLTAFPREHIRRVFFSLLGLLMKNSRIVILEGNVITAKTRRNRIHIRIQNNVISGEAIKKKSETGVKKYKLSERSEFLYFRLFCAFSDS
ncbi:MAG: hypothetical protein GX905_06310, partial [Bacteroidales bacterium]|nr:hypothetical protein [Bacteroidales bacterium]